LFDLDNLSDKEAFSSHLFKKIANKYIKSGINNEISSFIDKGAIIPLQFINLPLEKFVINVKIIKSNVKNRKSQTNSHIKRYEFKKIPIYLLKTTQTAQEAAQFNRFFGVKDK
jgi:hypothetical protein